ncbi:MAG TPA: FKBP-type peptidyl-prolyl cis-trans isomerase [Granulicella sp.]|jgi:peptidylprolyl isomerase|nr:FKBP-type peptidyl-prolyl cis-trans isomerase [Granulicella sp.]
MKLALTLLAFSTAAAAQTTAKPPVPHHHTMTATSAVVVNPPGAPRVVGVPKTLYALKYIDIKLGTGPLATTHHWLTVHYTGWLPNGKKFDSSVDRKEPFPFPYGAHRVIIGWDTGFEGMRVGGKRRLFVPWELAYGELGMPPRSPADPGMPPKQNLIFDVELLGISDTPPASMMPKPAPAPAPAPSAAPKPGAPAPAGQEPAPATPPPPAGAKPSTEPATPPPSAK